MAAAEAAEEAAETAFEEELIAANAATALIENQNKAASAWGGNNLYFHDGTNGEVTFPDDIDGKGALKNVLSIRVEGEDGDKIAKYDATAEKFVAGANADGVQGLDAFLTALNSLLAKENGLVDATNKADDAKLEDEKLDSGSYKDDIAKLTDTEKTALGISNAYTDKPETVQAKGSTLAGKKETADNNLTNLNKAVETWEGLVQGQKDLDALQDDIDAIEAAIKDDGYNFASGTTVTDDSDIFFFSDLNNSDSIAGFGAKYGEGQGDYLVASDYVFSVFTLEEGKSVDNDTVFGGAVDKLNIFAVQDGTDVKLYVENQAASGNMTYNNSNFTEITLTGITTNDLFFQDGIISAAIA